LHTLIQNGGHFPKNPRWRRPSVWKSLRSPQLCQYYTDLHNRNGFAVRFHFWENL